MVRDDKCLLLVCLGHSEARTQLWSLDWTPHETPAWLLLAVLGRRCLGWPGSAHTSRPGTPTWQRQRSRGITKAQDVSWGSELATPSPDWPKQVVDWRDYWKSEWINMSLAGQVGLIHKWKNKVACPTWQINGKMLNVRWVQWEETPEAPWETPKKCYG